MSRQAVRGTLAIAALSLAVLGPPVQAQDEPSAQELADLRASAEAGDTDTQVLLGAMYYGGHGVPQDYAEAVAWFRKAAEQSHAAALHPDIPKPGSGLRWDEFIDALVTAYRARFEA